MDSNNLNVTRGLVRAILTLTDEQRRSTNVQSLCQFIQCVFSFNDDEDHNGTCHVASAKFSSSSLLSSSASASSSIDEGRKSENTLFILLTKSIGLYIYPLFIFMGIFGNSVSCFIMFLNVRRNGYPANFYLSLLAFVDCLFLVGSAVPDWLRHIHYTLDIKLLSDLCCRFVYWFGNFTTHLSAGLVVSVTIERFIAIQYPLIAHKINSTTLTHVVVLVLISFFFLLDSRVFLLVKHFNESIHIVFICPNDTDIKYERRDISRCGTINEDTQDTWVLIDFAVYTLIPFLIIVTMNSLIIRRLIAAQRLRQRMIQSKRKHAQRDLPSEYSSIGRRHQQTLRRCRSVPSTRSQTNQQRLRASLKQSSASVDLSLKMQSQTPNQPDTPAMRQTSHTNNVRLTVLLLFVSCSFLVLTLPAVMINLLLAKKWSSKSSAWNYPFYSSYDQLHSEAAFYYTIGRLLMIMNHSINFILYFVFGKRFRRDLKRLFFHD